MSLNLTSKEKSLLQDQQNHEKVCIQKYQTYASQASDPQLQQLLNSYAEQEQQHLNTLNQILNGQVPAMSSSSSQSNGQSVAQSLTAASTAPSPQGMSNQQSGMQSVVVSSPSSAIGEINSNNDSALCNDMLMTEKFVSGAYDTAIFEFKDPAVRQALNHIQKEEQKHGEGLFQYMQSNGMYNPGS